MRNCPRGWLWYFRGLKTTARARQIPPEALDAEETTPVPARPVPNTVHKRQISEAIPRNERANAPEDRQAEGQAEGQGQALKDPQEGPKDTRKSTRARKALQLD